MVLVPAGEFLMGSETGEPSEQPEHVVYLDAFYIDRCEVSNAQYVTFLNAVGGHYGLCSGYNCAYVREDDPRARLIHIHYTDGQYVVEPGYENYPVGSVTWYGAQAYCEYYGLRLPTEAEWEKAARGTDGRAWPWGDEWDPTRLGRINWLDEALPVCSNPEGASPYGLLNMAGNVEEWVADWYSEGYYAVSPDHNPQGPTDGTEKTRRSALSLSPKEEKYYAHVTRRSGAVLTVSTVGVRCAADALDSKEP
jgi:formylglycine-generating enzyme required for sulfatase activity